MNPNPSRNEPDPAPRGSHPPVAPGYKWWVVFMLWFICFFNYADRQALSVVLPMLEEEFKFTPEQLGYISSAFMWVYAAGAPLAGYIGDRVRRKDLILGGCFFWSLVTMLTGWCGRMWHFVTVRALEGFGETFYFPASMSLVSDYHSPATRSRAMSFHQSSVYIGTIGGSWLGALIAQEFGWRMTFYAFGFGGLVLSVMLYMFLREPTRGQSDGPALAPAADSAKSGTPGGAEPGASTAGEALWLLVGMPMAFGLLLALMAAGSMAEVFWLLVIAVDLLLLLIRLGVLRVNSVPAVFWILVGSPTALLLLLAFMGANSVAAVFLAWTPKFLIDKFGFTLTEAALKATLYIQLASAASVPLGGMLADFLSRRLPGGRMFVQAGGLVIGSVFVFLVGTTGNSLTLLYVMSFFGLCKGFYDSNIFASIYDVVPAGARGATAGIMNMAGWSAGAVSVILFGRLASRGAGTQVENMSRTISFGGAVYLGSAVLLIVAALFFAKRDIGRVRAAAEA